MSHKVHPKIIKIKGIQDWLSRGFYQKNFPQYLEEDFKIREYLKKNLPAGSVANVEIERTQTVLKVIIKTSRPALVIGRGGQGVNDIKTKLEKLIQKDEKEKTDIKVDILEIRNPWGSASLVAQWVKGQLEKQVPFRRAMKMALEKVKDNKEIKGVKIEVSGRLNGVDISRREWIKHGKLPRQTFRADIDYALHEANCNFGVIGVKVWLYKGEKFD